MANDEFREQQQASREVGLKARHETRVERAQTVIGELEQQLRVHAEAGYVRVTIADEEGTTFHTMRLAPHAAERAVRIINEAVTVARWIDPKPKAAHPGMHPPQPTCNDACLHKERRP